MSGVPPCVREYLERLPAGIASYPECKAKASILRDILDSRPLEPDADDVHDGIRGMLAALPPVSSWVPEVHFVVASLTIYARYFGATDLPAMEEWICTRNTALFRKPLYRVLIALLSPERLLVGTSKRWSAFHLGSTLTVLDHATGSTHLRIEFPAHLYGPVMLGGMSAALRAAVNVAGGRDVVIGIEHTTSTSAEYWVRWST